MSKFLVVITQNAPLQLDYKVPEGDVRSYMPGFRVLVPYRRNTCVGIILASKSRSNIPASKLRSVQSLIEDRYAVVSQEVLALITWLGHYYHEDYAKVAQAILPSFFWDRAPVAPPLSYEEGTAPAQHRLSKTTQRLMSLLKRYGVLTENQLRQHKIPQKTIRNAQDDGLLKPAEKSVLPAITPPTLSDNQQHVAQAILADKPSVIQYVYGVTGSGKTHVYLEIVAQWTKKGGQVLWLLPEISLTPQLIDFLGSVVESHRIAVLHSGLTMAQKDRVKRMAFAGEISLLVGTRSAVFTPCKNLAGIIIDEEHDSSYKQLSGWRYSARGIACMRAKKANIPILLGSATPSLSCLFQAQAKSLPWHALTARFNKAVLPKIHLVKQEKGQTTMGFMAASLQKIATTLQQQRKVLIFINRRGFSPALWCESCNAIQQCQDCDKAFTFHQLDNSIRCHRCGKQQDFTAYCQSCSQESVVPIGQGTEKISRFMQEKYPHAMVVQMDRDTCPTWATLQEKLAVIRQPEPQILVATQMLVKSHNIPNLGLVVVLEADKALFSKDFRAQEYLLQQMHQVAGRAGRDGGESQVVIQTFHVDHPVWQSVQQHDYLQYAQSLLTERKKHQLPPYTYQALVAFTGPEQKALYTLAEKAQGVIAKEEIMLYPPIPSMVAKQAKMYRVVFMMQATYGTALHRALHAVKGHLEKVKLPSKITWGLDIDPIDW